ncbi:hypothetical protein SAMN05192575_101671 [Nocardioides alpinus]|uniref:Glycosyl transferase family 2 n=1 Tax=Nocardioides alpinus TaxID=748909 RepID=A0A1I0W4M6_9ACTN|nr:hypothetical protein [Nocardioides alpinus]PKH37659.1 hypothetical protein CXG46_19735 [Nocardioides alpinus]SFA83150.1 hypothetical protein SAMN05192575_101671 [Nocardioides alpinus]
MPGAAEVGPTGPTVTFETKVWEGDYRTILDRARLDAVISHNSWDFTARIVHVNNVDDPDQALSIGRALVADGVLDEVVLVDEHATDALNHFGLTRNDLGRGYVYSISELVSLYLCRTDYLLHLSGDTTPSGRVDWIPSALELLERRPEIAVANLSWTPDLSMVEAESSGRDGEFLLGYGFSDQMYLVRAAEFGQRIYGETHPASERYPEYGGELFEKRVDAWMRNHQRLRATWTSGHYVHENIRPAPSRMRRVLGRVKRATRI